jgi:UDP-glucose 4-epimerase
MEAEAFAGYDETRAEDVATMAVLVTGGAGYIGSHMVLALLDAGEEVVVLDNLSTGFDWALPPEAKLVVGDMGDEALVGRVIREHGVKATAHFAAKIVVPDSVADPLGYYLNNTVKSRALIEAAVKGGVEHFIFSSTAAVYGDVDTKPVGEDRPLNPVSPYGRSKLMTEWMLADAAVAHGLRYVVLRYFNVAGADPRGRSGQSTANATHLIKVAAQTALGQRKAIEIYGTDYPTPDGSCLRDYIQVSDLAAAHLDALTHLRRGGESLTLNCGYGTGYSVLEVVDIVKRVSGVDFEVRLSPRRAGDPAAIVAKADRIRERLGWQPRYDDLTTIVDQALRWEKALLTRNQI